MKKIILLFVGLVGIVLFSMGCVSNKTINEVDMTVLGTEENKLDSQENKHVTFEVPEGWTIKDNEAILGTPPPEDLGKETLRTMIEISVIDDMDEKEYAEERLNNRGSDAVLKNELIGNIEVYSVESEEVFGGGGDPCPTFSVISFSKENQVYSIRLYCSSMEDQIDLIKTVVSTIEIE